MSGKKTDEADKLPYSYHSFLFPFLWNISGEVKLEEFNRVIGKHWKEEKWEKYVHKNARQSGISDDEWKIKYAAYQYFTPAAQDILFNTSGKGNVHLYEYDFGEDAAAAYVIEKYEESKKEGCVRNTYTLKLTGVRLKVYDTGIAILIIEGENHDHRSLDAVNAINEHGRRVNLPFIPVPQGSPLCADSISITVNGKAVSTENFEGFIKKLHEDPENQNVSWDFIAKPIQYLIDGDGENEGNMRITTQKRSGEKYFQIRPCIDDRMFVCCLVRDKRFSKQLKGFDNERHAYHYLTGCDSSEPRIRELSDALYKLISVEKSITCNSAVMKKALLQKNVYDRWIDYGTIHGMCQHSVICVTGEESYLQYAVINPFLSQIVEMATLTVVQRSHQLLLFDRISDISEKFRNEAEMDDEQLGQIEKLQKLYVKCQNQILLPQVTVQEQGVELYDMMQERLMIANNARTMDEQMNNLRDVSTMSHDRLDRKISETRNRQEKIADTLFNGIGGVLAVLSLWEASQAFSDDVLIRKIIFYPFFAVACLVLIRISIYCFAEWWKGKKAN